MFLIDTRDSAAVVEDEEQVIALDGDAAGFQAGVPGAAGEEMMEFGLSRENEGVFANGPESWVLSPETTERLGVSPRTGHFLANAAGRYSERRLANTP